MPFSPPSPLPLVCAHKNTSRCALTLPGCCACSDSRPHTPNYYVYVDGVGRVPQGTRWESYCHHCKAYWECQIRRSGISASLSRIPDFPRSSTFDGPRSPRRTIPSAFSQMEHYYNPSGPARTSPYVRQGSMRREEPLQSAEGPRLQQDNHSRVRSVPTSPDPETRTSRVIQRPQSILISRIGGVDTPPSPVSPEEPPSSNHTGHNDIMRRQQQRLDALRHVPPPTQRTYSDTSSMGSMDAQASTTSGTVSDEIDISSHSRATLSLVESRAQITDIENQLDRLHARMMMGTRNRDLPRDYRSNGLRQATPRSYALRGFQNQMIPHRQSRREAYSSPEEADRTWSSVASVTSATTDNSLEVHASRTPDLLPSRPVTEYSQSEAAPSEAAPSEAAPSEAAHSEAAHSEAAHSEAGTTTSSPVGQPIWSLANSNSIQDIETELAHLSEGTARRSAELASLSQELESQTRQYAADVGGRDPDILGRANESLRRLRELRERREIADPQEHVRRVWGNVEDDDYVSPVSALFQRSWEAYTRRQQLEQEIRRHDPLSAWFDPAPSHEPADTGSPDPLATSVNEVVALLRNFRESLGDTASYDQAGPIDRAVEALVQLRNDIRRREVQRSRRPRLPRNVTRSHWQPPKGLDDDDSRPPPLEEADLKLDCECKICFGQIADTLLLPCNHLVLCGWCATQIGVSKLNDFSPRMIQCPVCRTEVLDRIKVFRG